jgi:hypothetical protein
MSNVALEFPLFQKSFSQCFPILLGLLCSQCRLLLVLLLLVVLFSGIVCIGQLGLLRLVVLLISWSLEVLGKLVVAVFIAHGVTCTSELGVAVGKSTVGFVSANTYERTTLMSKIKRVLKYHTTLFEVLALHCPEVAVALTTATMLLLLEGIRWKRLNRN